MDEQGADTGAATGDRGGAMERKFAAPTDPDAAHGEGSGGGGEGDGEAPIYHEFLRGSPRRHHGHTRQDYDLRGGERRGIRG